MPLGSSSAAPVTRPGPSSRNHDRALGIVLLIGCTCQAIGNSGTGFRTAQSRRAGPDVKMRRGLALCANHQRDSLRLEVAQVLLPRIAHVGGRLAQAIRSEEHT